MQISLMAKKQEQRKEIRATSDTDLHKVITDGKETLRTERFKDKFSRKAGLIRQTKRQVARAHTELTARATANNT